MRQPFKRSYELGVLSVELEPPAKMNPVYPVVQSWFLIVVFLFLLGARMAAAEGESAGVSRAAQFGIDLGVQYVGWTTPTYGLPYGGMEFWTPLSVTASPAPGLGLYGQTEFGQGQYTDSLNGTRTQTLTNLSDTVLGLKADFKTFGFPAMADISFNIPTGDPSWETQVQAAEIPSEFVDPSYRGRGFGMNALYALSFASPTEQYGVGAGYCYSAAFNPNYGLGAEEQLKMGDSVFISLNRAGLHGGETDIAKISAFYFLPTQIAGQDSLQMGPNLNASYAWINPQGLSIEGGGQYFFPALRSQNGQLTSEPYNSLGPRFYLTLTYPFGDFTATARAKYLLANGYPQGDAYYDGGGWVAGLEPSYLLKLDGESALRLKASFDAIDAFALAADYSGNRSDASYYHWSFGTDYEVKW
jgi:hypothetical protein